MFVVETRASTRFDGSGTYTYQSADSACKAARHGSDVLIPPPSRVVERRRVCVVELAIGPFSILVFYTLCLLL
jgi:hypothetical protein